MSPYERVYMAERAVNIKQELSPLSESLENCWHWSLGMLEVVAAKKLERANKAIKAYQENDILYLFEDLKHRLPETEVPRVRAIQSMDRNKAEPRRKMLVALRELLLELNLDTGGVDYHIRLHEDMLAAEQALHEALGEPLTVFHQQLYKTLQAYDDLARALYLDVADCGNPPKRSAQWWKYTNLLRSMSMLWDRAASDTKRCLANNKADSERNIAFLQALCPPKRKW